MSQLITLTTEKNGVFANYFENTIKIPKNSEVAFIKAMGINMNYFEYNFITAPFIDDADRTQNILRVVVDGVSIALSWRRIYNAYVRLCNQASGTIPVVPVTEDDFFSGGYKWTLDPRDVANVIDTLCEAMTEEFTFYKISPNCKYNNINFEGVAIPSHFGITSTYVTNKRLNNSLAGSKPLASYLDPLEGKSVYAGAATLQPDSIETTSGNTAIYSTTKLAINGGFVQFTLNSDIDCVVGVSFNSNHVVMGVTGNNIQPEIDFGIHYKANGTGTYWVIREGQEQQECLGMNGPPSGREQDQFVIAFSRTAQPESKNASAYTAFLLQGYDPISGSGQWEEFIVARQEMEGGFMPSFLMKGGSGVKLENLRCIEANEQDIECRSFYDYTEASGERAGGTTYRNAHWFYLVNSVSLTEDARRNTQFFFQEVGFINWANDENTGETEYPMVNVIGNMNPANPLIISSRLEGPIQNKRIVSNSSVGDDSGPGNSTYPYLQLHMDDMGIITHEGNEPNGRQQNTATKVLTNLGKQNDLILQDDTLGTTQVYQNYDYEAYNPIYVSLNNPEPIQFNQIRSRLVGPNNEEIRLANTGDRTIIMVHIRKETQ